MSQALIINNQYPSQCADLAHGNKFGPGIGNNKDCDCITKYVRTSSLHLPRTKWSLTGSVVGDRRHWW